MDKDRRTTDSDGNGVLFLCDQRACEVCYPECRHTNDIRHAKGFKFHRTNKGGFGFRKQTNQAMIRYDKSQKQLQAVQG